MEKTPAEQLSPTGVLVNMPTGKMAPDQGLEPRHAVLETAALTPELNRHGLDGWIRTNGPRIPSAVL